MSSPTFTLIDENPQKTIDEVLIEQQSHSERLLDKPMEKGFSFKFDYVATIGKTGHEGNGHDEFNRPDDVIITRDRYLIVADKENERLQVFIEDYSLIWKYFTTIKTPQVKPYCLELKESESGEETLWVLGDHSNQQVLKFSNISQFISDINNGKETKPEQVDKKTSGSFVNFQFSITTDKFKGWSIRSEPYEHELEVYGADFEMVFKYAKDKGSGPGNDQLYVPCGSCIDYKHGHFLIW
ncbi:predicted protein [Naegleria gruberi]|uniref:Predicted protein n=1 Tax=Naegleria gruberi TaxID=5762 RepID=D2VIX0_NAEGR|nr:uncharacterized protein NAEGRDRAFT_49910 [Naegleria gruberi]EFC43099.1 predicted protein [Naegleria gruberi]|eukprot:XP_002675843.1 predicted protein [Naegleria gruberi strain NEG-M]